MSKSFTHAKHIYYVSPWKYFKAYKFPFLDRSQMQNLHKDSMEGELILMKAHSPFPSVKTRRCREEKPWEVMWLKWDYDCWSITVRTGVQTIMLIETETGFHFLHLDTSVKRILHNTIKNNWA